ncbi:hypothetical protein AX289_31340 [Methylorubrum populi]|nr:hypothetical protein AX289_31340 [Methylorubrum populi]
MINENKTPVPPENPFWRFDDDVVAETPRRVQTQVLYVTAIFAALSYASFRALGWIIDGFTGADR